MPLGSGFEAFRRPDPQPGVYEVSKTLLLSIFALPVRALVLCWAVCSFYGACRGLFWMYGGQPPRRLLDLLTIIFSRAALLALGFWHIDVRDSVARPSGAVCIVTNHVSWLDILVLMCAAPNSHHVGESVCAGAFVLLRYRFQPSFVCKAGVFDIPLIGWLARDVLCCIPVRPLCVHVRARPLSFLIVPHHVTTRATILTARAGTINQAVPGAHPRAAPLSVLVRSHRRVARRSALRAERRSSSTKGSTRSASSARPSGPATARVPSGRFRPSTLPST